MKKQYITPELLVHGSVEDLTLGTIAKVTEGNDGCGIGLGEGDDGTQKICS